MMSVRFLEVLLCICVLTSVVHALMVPTNMCLRDLSSSARCCSPQPYVEVSFFLRLNSDGRCDPPDHVGQGVKLEVRLSGRNSGWIPIRFYTPSMATVSPSFVSVLNTTHVHVIERDYNNTFPVYLNDSTDAIHITEYLCGQSFASQNVRLRWSQFELGTSGQDEDTWSIDDVTVTLWNGSCHTIILEEDFEDSVQVERDWTVRFGDVRQPPCGPTASGNAVYFGDEVTNQDRSSPRRRRANAPSLNIVSTCASPPPSVQPGCSLDAVCTAAGGALCSLGELSCGCPEGREGLECTDVDECVEGLHNCSQRCVNTLGSFECQCSHGYQLAEDGVTCADLDECVDGTHNCTGQCVNVEGGFECSCTPGLTLGSDGVSCVRNEVVIGLEHPTEVAETSGSVEVCARVLNGTLLGTVTISLSTSDGTATAPVDYQPVTDDLTFDPATSVRCVDIRIVNDRALEATESFAVNLTSPDPNVMLLPNSGTVEIRDNDIFLIGIERTSYTVREGEGRVEVCVGMQGSSSLGVEAQAIISTADGTARAGSDYQALSVELTFDPFHLRRCVNISLVDDDVVEEGRESFSVEVVLSRSELSIAIIRNMDMAVINIQDDDALTIGLEEAAYTVREGDEVAVTVTVAFLQGSRDREATVLLHTLDDTAVANVDYTPVSVSLTLSSSAPRASASVPVVDNDVDEEARRFTLLIELVGEQENMETLFFHPTEASVTILDDDIVTVGLESSQYEVGEGAGVVEVCAVVVAGTPGRAINVTLSTSSGTATAPSDYQSASVQLTFQRSSLRSCVDIAIEEDHGLETVESFSLTLSSDGDVQLDPGSGIVVIHDNDDVDIGFDSVVVVAGEERGTVALGVSVKEGQLGVPVRVRAFTQDGIATSPEDYEPLDTMLTFDSFTTIDSVRIRIEDDARYEDEESFFVMLQAVDPSLSINISFSPAMVVITDNDEVTLALERGSYSVGEGGGGVEVCVTVVVGSLERELSASLVSQSSSATAGMDFDPTTVGLTFAAGTNQSCTFIAVVDDGLAEDNETFAVVVTTTAPHTSLSLDTATITIVDNDMVTVGFDPQNITETETVGSVVMAVHLLEGQLDTSLTLRVFTEDSTATGPGDYLPLDTLLTFDPSTSVHMVHINVTDDGSYEHNESFLVRLELEDAPVSVSLTPSSVVVTIIDDDEVILTLERGSYSVGEGGGGVEVCVTVVVGSLERELSVSMVSQSSSATVADYIPFSIELTFDPTTNRSCVLVSVLEDTSVEDVETLSLSLSSSASRVSLQRDTASITIMDNDHVDECAAGTHNCSQMCRDKERGFECDCIPGYQLEEDGASCRDVDECADGSDPCDQLCTNTEGSFQCSCDPGFTLNDNGFSCNAPEEEANALQQLISEGSLSPDEAAEQLEDLLNTLLASGEPASEEFSMAFTGAVSSVIDQSSSGSDENSTEEESSAVASSLLQTLDSFALDAFNPDDNGLQTDTFRLAVELLDSSGSQEVIGVMEDGNEIILPPELIQNSGGDQVRVASFFFRNLTGFLPDSAPGINGTRLVSPVVSSSLSCGDSPCSNTTSQPVRIRLTHPSYQADEDEPLCVFWQFVGDSDNMTGQWSTDGCAVNQRESSLTTTVCECNHLTHFAILLSPNNQVSEEDAFALQVIGYVGVSISLVCLTLTVAAFLFLRSLWSMRNFIHVNLCINLMVSQIIFVAGVDKTDNVKACQAVAILLHYFFLVTFMWMLMEGVVLYVALVRVFVTNQKKYMTAFAIVSYGLPALYMGLTVPLGLALKNGPHYGGDACWLKYETHFVWAFIAPVIIIILINIGFFIMAIVIMSKHEKKQLRKSQLLRAKYWLKSSITLLLIMGITWIIGVLSFHEYLLPVAYIFTIFVAFQGLFIFILFVPLSKQVRDQYKKWWGRKVAESDFLSNYFGSNQEKSFKHQLELISLTASSGAPPTTTRLTSLRTSSFSSSMRTSSFSSSSHNKSSISTSEHYSTSGHQSISEHHSTYPVETSPPDYEVKVPIESPEQDLAVSEEKPLPQPICEPQVAVYYVAFSMTLSPVADEEMDVIAVEDRQNTSNDEGHDTAEKTEVSSMENGQNASEDVGHNAHEKMEVSSMENGQNASEDVGHNAHEKMEVSSMENGQNASEDVGHNAHEKMEVSSMENGQNASEDVEYNTDDEEECTAL